MVAVAANGSRPAGALAALSAAAWFDFFLTRPYQRFAITDRDDIETAVLLLIVGLVVSQLAVRVRRLQVTVVTDAAYLACLQDTARIAEGGSPQDVVEHVRRELIGLLRLRGCRFEHGRLMGRPPRLEHDGSVWVGRRPWDRSATTGRRARSNCAPSGVATITDASCSTRSPAPCPRHRPAS